MKPPKRGICCVWTFRALGMSNNRFCLANRTIRGKTILPVKKQIQNAMIKYIIEFMGIRLSGFVSKDTKFLVCTSRYPKEGYFFVARNSVCHLYIIVYILCVELCWRKINWRCAGSNRNWIKGIDIIDKCVPADWESRKSDKTKKRKKFKCEKLGKFTKKRYLCILLVLSRLCN